MEKYIGIFTKMSFVILAVWVVLAGFGFTSMPKLKLQDRVRRQRAKGQVWGDPVASAPDAEDNLAFPESRAF